jgi:hypothetical protein
MKRLVPTALGTTLCVAMLAGCSQDYAITAIDGDGSEAGVAPTAGADALSTSSGPAASTEAPTTGDVDNRGAVGHGADDFDPDLVNYGVVKTNVGSAYEVLEDPDMREREESFTVEPLVRTPIVDFLFVVDNSTSMGQIRDLVRSGLEGMSQDDPFPAESRIAVMSTMPADPNDLTSLHPRVNDQGAQSHEPGFLRLVDRRGIAHFRKASPELANRFKINGCNDAWFSPWQDNADGVPCLIAHTQISRTPVRVEAGLSALQQFFEKNAGETTFREGASVNVVFVSDTHSPGLAGGEGRLRKTGLEVDPITYEDLRDLVDKDNLVSSFRVHAIAPATECVEEWAHLGPRYFNVAKASGGSTLDICTAQDYAPFIRELVENSDVVQHPIFPLGREVTQLHSVQLDGVDVEFDVVGDGTAVRLRTIDPSRADRALTVNYRY